MSSSYWDPNTAIVPFILDNMDPSNDSSIGERLKSRRATRSDRRCLRDTVKTEGPDSTKDPTIDPKKNHKSSITSNSVAQISRTFGLPLSGLRIPNAAERPKDGVPEEIVVYEALFSYGFRGTVPSLVVEVSRYLGLSPDIGHLNKDDEAAGKRTIKQLLEIPSERRSLEFLFIHLVLERNTIWDCNMSESQRASAHDSFEFFLVASGKLAEMGSSAHAPENQVTVTEFPRGGTRPVGKRKVERSPGDPIESQRVKVSPFLVGEIGGSHSFSWVEDMKNKLLSWDMEAIAGGGVELAADEVCRTLLKIKILTYLKISPCIT
ncbi:unnamed protein product [Cochlearia groenlandica]